MLFFSCDSLSTIIIPANIANVEWCAFNMCKSLSTVKFEDSDSLCNIGKYAFTECPIKSLYLGRRINGISESFDHDSLRILTLGSSLKDSISFVVFDKLEKVISCIKDPRQLVPKFSDNVYKNALLSVPVGTKPSYLESEGWKRFFNMKDENELTSIQRNRIVSSKKIMYYDLYGRKIDVPSKGQVLIRRENNSCKKILY